MTLLTPNKAKSYYSTPIYNLKDTFQVNLVSKKSYSTIPWQYMLFPVLLDHFFYEIRGLKQWYLGKMAIFLTFWSPCISLKTQKVYFHIIAVSNMTWWSILDSLISTSGAQFRYIFQAKIILFAFFIFFCKRTKND